MSANIYSFSVQKSDGETQALEAYKGKVMLIVNVASRCGNTQQYEGLEELYRKYKDKGLVILGFPCNQFGGQEPGTNQEIQSFCKLTYGVTFPVMGKIEVNGKNESPLYRWLKANVPGTRQAEPISWNFTKFLVNRKGEVVKRFASGDKPEDLVKPIEALLAETANL